MMSASVKVLSIVLLCAFVRSHELPKDFGRCHASDGDCITKRTNEILRKYPHGYPELGLPDIEPFRIDDIKLVGNPNSPVNFNLEMTDLTVHNHAKTNFVKFSGYTTDSNNIQGDTEMVNPKLIIKGKYKISGQLLVLPITGEGDIEVTVTGLHIKSRVKHVTEVRDGRKYLKVESLKLKLKADNVHTEMENLFNGDKVLGENMLKIMNENWKLLWDELEPQFNRQMAKANSVVIDKIMNNIPYDELFIVD